MKFYYNNFKSTLPPYSTILFIGFFCSILSCIDTNKYEGIYEKESLFLSGKLIPDNHFLGDNTCKEFHNAEFKD